MFREIILPIFRSTRLCVTACGMMYTRCCRPPAGKRFFRSVKITDRSRVRYGPLSNRVSLTNFLKRTAGGTWIGLPPLCSAKLTSAGRSGSAVLLFFTALCLVKCSEGCNLYHTVWCNLIHTLTINRLSCRYNWLALLLNNQLYVLSIFLGASPIGPAV